MFDTDTKVIKVMWTGTLMDNQLSQVVSRAPFRPVFWRAPEDDLDSGQVVELVPTGSVEWEGDLPIEIYVPEDCLDRWHAMYHTE